MKSTDLEDYSALVKTMQSLVDRLDESSNGREWMNKKQAQNHVNLGKQAFQKLVDDNVIPAHSLDNHGLARLERFNRTELDNALKSL